MRMRVEHAIAALMLVAAAGRVQAQFPPEIRGRVLVHLPEPAVVELLEPHLAHLSASQRRRFAVAKARVPALTVSRAR